MAEKGSILTVDSNGKKRSGLTKRQVRLINKRASKVVENVKRALFVRGGKTSEIVNHLLTDLYQLKKPEGIQFKKRNDTHPFEDASLLEFLSVKNDASLFAFGSHSKKRPQNMILGRFFDYHLLDMVELGVENYKPLSEFKTESSSIGNRPCFIFQGDEFEQKEEFKKIKNILLDFYRGSLANTLHLSGLEHVIICTSNETGFYFRVYKILLKKSGVKIPRVELQEMGPSIDFSIRRFRFASSDLIKAATRVPKELFHKKIKNQTTDVFGTKGIIHTSKQNLFDMATKKMKGLKKRKKVSSDEGPNSKKQK